jgi:tetratricopeptide (TPR) repeat protein
VRAVVVPTGSLTSEGAQRVESLVRLIAGNDLDLFACRGLALIWREAGVEHIGHAIDLQRQALSLAVGDLAPRRPELLFSLGNLLAASGQTRAALDAFEEVIRLEPYNADALNNAAYYLSESLGEPAAALEYARRAVSVRPGSWSLLDTLGWVLYRTGDFADAKQQLFRSVQIRETAVNTYHLAAVYAKEGDSGNAHRYLRRALQLNPDPATKAEIDRLADDI